MDREKKSSSSGQALVLVTLALIAMAGMLGLAVDLGWSFFVQKQAQAAADGAALASVQEAVVRARAAGVPLTGIACGANADCQTTPVSCGSIASTSNLWNGCQYASKNGFGWTGRQNVTMVANVNTISPTGTNLPPTAPGILNISYWVTVRTVQTIPQLFSAVLGNATGTVSARATAAIAGSVAPGSFYGMNRRGDCTNSLNGTHCGLDILIGTGQGKTDCPGNPGINGSLCAPAGVIIASSCNSNEPGICDDGVAANATGGAGVEASSLTIMGSGPPPDGGKVTGDFHDPSGQPLSPTYTTNASTFQDPTFNKNQPPLQSSAPIGACGITGGTIPGGSTLGPYQYYSTTTNSSNQIIPNGQPIRLQGNVTFSSSGGCPGLLSAGAAQNGQFPTYIFYGGLVQSGTTTLGPGQYVMAGTLDGNAGSVFSANGTVTGDSSTGTMFIFTDGQYPGLAGPTGQESIIPNMQANGATPLSSLYQGTLSFQNADITLNGLISSINSGSNLPSNMDDYSGIAWWQDRRNSLVQYNKDYAKDYSYISSPACSACTGDDGSVVNCNIGCAAGTQTNAEFAENGLPNGSSSEAPGVILDPGNVQLDISGVYYQPRGAWLEIHHGTGNTVNTIGSLQVITGALIEDTGDTRVLLQGPTNPIVTFKATLIE